jgi:ribonuclease G
LPFNWFRRRKADREQAPAEAAAPAQRVVPEPPPPRPAATATATTTQAEEQAAKKRRRGARGGRGRKKPATTAPKTEAKAKEKPEPVRSQAEERRLQQRKERKGGGERRRREPPRRAPLPEAKRELLVAVDVGEQRVAVLEDDRVAEVYLERPERRSIAGNIYFGTVDNVLPGMEAAFVEIGLEKNGFLYVDEIVRPELEGRSHGKRIQDILKRGETVLVQAVKDPMKSKGARLTMEISLPGRFVVYVPHGDGLGVSRRLEDDERQRLKDILKAIAPKQGGVIVRTAAEGASAEDVERDLDFLQKLWKTIEAQAKKAKPPTLIYQEAELPLRVTRDLFTENFEKAYIDDEKAFKRIVGYLKKTSPHMVERVVRWKEKEPLFEAYGVDAEIKSTLNRRVDLPSGGYLIFDYAEAFTVVDVNTGRFVGGRGKNSGARLEDTITKNNLEAVKEVVRQLRLRDIGGIIVIDFIDMANPKNRGQVEEALRTELERDRTKTYVVEISPLGLVEMTRQNVTEGPREVMTRKCPTCGGDGIVLSDETAAIEVERRLRQLARGSRVQAFLVEVNPKVASLLVGPGGSRLEAIEAASRRRFFLVPKAGIHLDHVHVLKQGKLETIAPEAPVEEGAEVELQLVEVGLHDPHAAVAKLDGYDVCVADASKLVGKKVKARIARIQPGTAYATLLSAAGPSGAITAEGEAEKPTRARKPAERKTAESTPAEQKPAEQKPKPKRAAAKADAPAKDGAAAKPAARPKAAAPAKDEEPGEAEAPKKKTRRGSRGGRNRRKKPTTATTAATAQENGAPTIHVPPADLGQPADEPPGEAAVAAEAEAPSENGSEPTKPRKKTRRGSRGGRNRRKKPATAAAADTAGEASDTSAEAG